MNLDATTDVRYDNSPDDMKDDTQDKTAQRGTVFLVCLLKEH